MKILKVLALAFVPMFLISCGQPPQSSNSSQQQASSPDQSKALLNDISGVWKDSDTMWTIVVENGQLQFLLNDEPKLAKIGDIDTENQTINLLIQRTDTGQEAIWTIRKIDSENGSYSLNVIAHDGESYDLSFVRKIGADDKNRIRNIFLEAEQQQREALRLEQEAQEQAQLAEEQQVQEQMEATETIPVEETSAEPENESVLNTETTELAN